MYRALVLSS